MGNGKKLTVGVKAAQLNTEALIKLLGGTADDRLRWWEIVKGLTTPAQLTVLTHQLAALEDLAKQTQVSVKALQKSTQANR